MDGLDTSARMPFGVLINRNGNRVLLGLSGEFSSEGGSRFEEAIEEISHEPVADLIVDLSGITYMDASGAYLLYELYKRFRGQANVMIEGGSGEIQRIFESAGLIGVMPIAFPGAAHPSSFPAAGPDHDWRGDPGHPHRAVPYVGLPRPGMWPRRRG
jgi:anti-anti-sigma factor